MPTSSFGTGVPVVYLSSAITLNYFVETKIEFDENIVEQKSELTGEREFIWRGSFLNFEGYIHLQKDGTPSTYYTTLKGLHKQKVKLKRFSSWSNYYKDLSNNDAYFYCTVEVGSIDNLRTYDLIYLKFRSLKEIAL